MTRIQAIDDLAPGALAVFDDIIDVRSPSEFAHDHIPGAINLPVLDDTQRAEVGTIYVQESKFRARRLGAGYVSRNIAHHIEAGLSTKPANYRPLIYCWRGGMRSNAMATVLSAVGWRASIVSGGYKSWRRRVVENLRDCKSPLWIVLLDGQTGTAKTAILKLLMTAGLVQVLDLEGLAHHRGSVFGGLADEAQPSQKMFESELWWRLSQMDLARPVLVEAESNLIGRCSIPERMMASMKQAQRIEVSADLDVRAKYLASAYRDLTFSSDRLERAIEKLRPFQTRAMIESWLAMAQDGEMENLAGVIAQEHYDPLYAKQRGKYAPLLLARQHLQSLDDAELRSAAVEIERVLLELAATPRLAPTEAASG